MINESNETKKNSLIHDTLKNWTVKIGYHAKFQSCIMILEQLFDCQLRLNRSLDENEFKNFVWDLSTSIIV